MLNTRASALVRGGVIALVAVVLAFAAWRALTFAMAHFWALARPETALDWRPSFPEALLAKAATDLRNQSPGVREEVRDALRGAPLEGKGYRLLAQEAAARNDARTPRLYSIAVMRGPRDMQALAWNSELEIRDGDYRMALRHLDQMLRIEPQRTHLIAPLMTQLAVYRPAQAEFVRMLQSSPPWREEILARILARSPDVSGLAALVERLRKSPQGLREPELSAWVDRLAHDRQWGPAYMVWVQTLSPEQSQHIGNVFNGSFEAEPSQSGFDWRYKNEPGVQIARAQVSGAHGTFALRVEFQDRRVRFGQVRQLLALAPGRYRLNGRMRLDDLRSERGLVWTVTCAEDGRVIGETTPMSGRREWTNFSAEVSVPESRCGGQWLGLRLPARIAAEERIGGVAWYDDLRMKQQ